MTSFLRYKPRLAAALVLVLAAPVLAQSSLDSGAEARLRKIEAEIGALQRKVFPGGEGTFFPQIQPGTAGTAAAGTPASAPSTDMLARMDAIESQIARLTSQVEESGNKVGQIEGRLAKLEAGAIPAAASAAPAAAPTTAAMAPKPAPAALSAAASAAPAAAPTAAAKPAPAAKSEPAAKPVPAATRSAAPSATRVAAVRAVEKPATSDPGDDEYSYGYRLWEAKFYPEAQQQLKLYLQKYPKHARISFARNLLGRTYLDEGNFDEAGKWFYENYKADKNGARAPDSVLFLAETWLRKKDTNRVCIALAQFVDDYPAEAVGRLRSQYDGVRSKVKCN